MVKGFNEVLVQISPGRLKDFYQGIVSAVHAGLEICDLESSRTLADHAAAGKLGLECVKLILVTVGSDEYPLYAIIVYGIGHEGGGLDRIVVEDQQEASFIGFSYIRLICSLIHDRWGTS